MKVLVIFDLIPEENKRAIVEMTEEEYSFFSKAHNVYVNASDDEEGETVALVINNALSTVPDHKQYCDTDKQREYFGKWESDLDNSDISEVKKIICTGFYL